MKKALWTLNIDNYAPQITEITYPLLERYANKIGAEFRVISKRHWPNMPPVYEKLQLFELGALYDWNLYVDSDALIHPDFFDVTEHLNKDTVLHSGNDMAGNRWRYDEYFRRDGRHIGSCNWFTVASDWCLDLWRPLDDLTPNEAYLRIFPTVNELNTVITREHLIDDFVLSRNIARYGLKFRNLETLCAEMGRRNDYLWHIYTATVPEKVAQMRNALAAWGLTKKQLYRPLGIEGWMAEPELQWLHDQARNMLSIAEIGSWKGRSTHALLTGCGGSVYAIDHFKGSPTERETTHAEAAEGDIYNQFIKNVGNFSNLTILQQDSLSAANLFQEGELDMVFIDGDHSYEGCLADICTWRPKVRRLICGHDRDQEGVPQALKSSGIKWEPGPGSIWFSKVA